MTTTEWGDTTEEIMAVPGYQLLEEGELRTLYLSGITLYEYWPIFDDETGDFIGDEEIEYGFKKFRIIAGPYDTVQEADAASEVLKQQYGIS